MVDLRFELTTNDPWSVDDAICEGISPLGYWWKVNLSPTQTKPYNTSCYVTTSCSTCSTPWIHLPPRVPSLMSTRPWTHPDRAQDQGYRRHASERSSPYSKYFETAGLVFAGENQSSRDGVWSSFGFDGKRTGCSWKPWAATTKVVRHASKVATKETSAAAVMQDMWADRTRPPAVHSVGYPKYALRDNIFPNNFNNDRRVQNCFLASPARIPSKRRNSILFVWHCRSIPKSSITMSTMWQKWINDALSGTWYI